MEPGSTAADKTAPGYQPTKSRRPPSVAWTDQRGQQSRIIDDVLTVGAADSADLVLNDASVSRLHAELDPQESGLWVRDLGSRNGVFIDGVRVAAGCAPERGRIVLGHTELTVSYHP